MKIVVLGGYGLTGQCAVRDLTETLPDAEIIIAGRNLNKAQKLANQLNDKKVATELVDVTKYDEIVESVRGANVVINAVQYYYNLQIMKACLEAKANYVDLGGLFHVTKEQMRLDADFKKSGLTAVISMGAQPGITNVMAKYAVERLDTVETIHIRDGWKDLTVGAPPFLVTWSFLTLMDELTLPAIVFENGEFKEVPPLSRKETVTFPDPVGAQDVYVTLHSEVLLLPNSFKDKNIKNVDWLEGGPGFIRNQLLIDMKLASDKPIKFQGVEIAPREFVLATLESNDLLGFPEGVIPNDWETTKVEVIGEKEGKKMTYTLDAIFPPKKEWRVSCSQYAVGIPASIVAQMIVGGEIQQRGVVPPEICVEPEPFFNELGKRGIQIHVALKKPLN